MRRLPAYRTSQGRFSLLASRVADTFLHIYHVGCHAAAFSEGGTDHMKPHPDRPKGTANSGRSKIRASQFALCIAIGIVWSSALDSITTVSDDQVTWRHMVDT
jgi:hypothetical protein